MSDRVQLLKQESSRLGGDDRDADPFGAPEPLDPREDMAEVHGLYLQDARHRDERVRIFRKGNDIVFRDPRSGRVTLTELLRPKRCPCWVCRTTGWASAGVRRAWSALASFFGVGV